MRTPETVCRVCLASGDVKLHFVDDRHLLETYEKLTKTQLNTKDGLPNMLCYVCVWRLQKCRHFSDMALRSDMILRERQYDNQIHDAIKTMGFQRLLKTAAQFVSTDSSDVRNSQVNYVCMSDSTETNEKVVKEEISIKVEREGGFDDFDNSIKILPKQIKTRKTKYYLRCDKCNKKFNKPNRFKAHLEVHDNLFSCDSCNKKFNYISLLNRHMKSHIKSYVCDRCSKEFKLKSALVCHMRIHTGEKPFACELCGKTFKQNSQMKTHRLTHTGIKPFPCNFCSKSFRQRTQLVCHTRTHTGEKPFTCNNCDMKFAHPATLRNHKRLHTEVKLYPCTMCPLSFHQERRLTNHMRVHTAVRSHSCSKCEKAFRQARHLKEHLLTVHSSERPHA